MIPQNGTALPRRPAARDRDDDVVARLERLGTALDGEPDPAFRAATRTRLVAMAAVRTPAPAPVSRLRTFMFARADDAVPVRWRTRLTAGLAGAALTVTTLAALTALASGARPGDLLYGLKRGTEQTQLALTSDSTRGQTLLGFASTRLGELRALVDDGSSAMPVTGAANGPGPDILAAGSSPALVLQTLHTMDAQTTDGAASLDGRSVSTQSTAPLDRLTAWAAGQRSGLTALQSDIPTQAAPAFAHSLGLLTGITSRAAALGTAVGCASGPAVSGTDSLGPVPGSCAVTPPSASAGTGTTTTLPPTRIGSDPTSTPPVSGIVPGGTGTGTGTGGSGAGGSGSGTGGGIGGVLPTPPSTGGILPTLPTLPTLPIPKITITVPGAAAPHSTSPAPSPQLPLCDGTLPLITC